MQEDKMHSRTVRNIFFIILFITIFAFQGFPQQISKLALVNSQKVFELSTEGKKAISQLKDRESKIKEELGKLDNKLQELQTKFNTQRLTLTEEALSQLASDIERARTDRKRYEEDSTRDYQRLQLRLWQKVRDEVVPIIEQLGKEKGFDVVLDLAGASIIYFNPAVDITDEVVKRYDASKTK